VFFALYVLLSLAGSVPSPLTHLLSGSSPSLLGGMCFRHFFFSGIDIDRNVECRFALSAPGRKGLQSYLLVSEFPCM